MPTDRAFTLAEKKLKQIETILFLEEYDAVLSTVGTLTKSFDMKFEDWKTAVNTYQKNDKGFKITDAKVLALRTPK